MLINEVILTEQELQQLKDKVKAKEQALDKMEEEVNKEIA